MPCIEFAAATSPLVHRKIMREGVFKLQGDALTHHANGVDGIDQCLRIGIRKFPVVNRIILKP